MKNGLIIAVTGASGAIYARRLFDKLEVIKEQSGEIAAVFSDTAISVWEDEIAAFRESDIPCKVYDNQSFYVPFASGSSLYKTMIIIPASMGTAGRIAAGVSQSLIGRAADVMLKEGRKLIIVPREMPYSLIHLRNLTKLAEAGAKIIPASPSFYHKPESIIDLVDTVIERVLDSAGFEIEAKRWKS